MTRGFIILSTFLCTGIPTEALTQQEEENGSSWLSLSSEDRASVEEHASEYKAFMKEAKTELHFVREAVRILRDAGFTELDESRDFRPGTR
ncbi:MAG: hypothetical protein ACRD21_14775, partial [Vicinamibacteria bacterium]